MITIDPSSPISPYEQLRVAVIAAVEAGELAPGHRLPTVRAYADELGVAPGTVARAYRELEALGVIETFGRNGTFVATHGDPVRQQVQRAAADYADLTRNLGLSASESLAIVSAAIGD